MLVLVFKENFATKGNFLKKRKQMMKLSSELNANIIEIMFNYPSDNIKQSSPPKNTS